jgi:hypothetical protein
MNQDKKNQSEQVAERLKIVLAKIGIAKTKIGQEIGANKDSLGRAIRDGRVSKTILVGLTNKYNINPSWLIDGIGNMYITDEKEHSDPVNEWKDKYIACLEEKTQLQKQLIELKSRINA